MTYNMKEIKGWISTPLEQLLFNLVEETQAINANLKVLIEQGNMKSLQIENKPLETQIKADGIENKQPLKKGGRK